MSGSHQSKWNRDVVLVYVADLLCAHVVLSPPSDTLRKQAWPKLLGLHCLYESEKPKDTAITKARPGLPRPPLGRNPPLAPPLDTADDLSVMSIASSRKKGIQVVPRSDDGDQIDRDVARCTWHLLIGSQRSRRLQMKNKHRKKMGALIKKKQRRLSNLINLTLLRTYPDDGGGDRLKYYQGYHDIASIFLIALGGGGAALSNERDQNSVQAIAGSIGLDLPSRVLAQLSESHLRDAMRSNFLELQTALKLTLFPLISAFDSEVHNHLWQCDMAPFFCLSWVITWFAHDIRDTALVTRLFDAFLVSHPLFPIYMSVAMVCHPLNRVEILTTECDFAEVHQVLAALPKNSSMVGWKFRPGDGYVSGEDEADDGTASTDMDVSFLDQEMLEGRDDEESDTQSIVSHMTNVGKDIKVPFQDLIDNAISYMRRIPPRKLLMLAKRYYQDETLIPMMTHAQNISLLQSPPRWALVATQPADWVLKQRLRTREGRSSTRRERRNRDRSRSRSASRANSENDVVKEKQPDRQGPPHGENDKEIDKYLEEQKKSLAVIACGLGPCEDDESRQRRRRVRKILILAGFAMGLLVVSVVVIKFGILSRSGSTQCIIDTDEDSSMQAVLTNSPESPEKSLNYDSTPKIDQVSIAVDGSIVVVESSPPETATASDEGGLPPSDIVEKMTTDIIKRSRLSSSKDAGSRGSSAKDGSAMSLMPLQNDIKGMMGMILVKNQTKESVNVVKPTGNTGQVGTNMKTMAKASRTTKSVVATSDKPMMPSMVLLHGQSPSRTESSMMGVPNLKHDALALERAEIELISTPEIIDVETTLKNIDESKSGMIAQPHQPGSIPTPFLLIDRPAAKKAIKIVGNIVREVREAFRDSDAMGEL